MKILLHLTSRPYTTYVARLEEGLVPVNQVADPRIPHSSNGANDDNRRIIRRREAEEGGSYSYKHSKAPSAQQSGGYLLEASVLIPRELQR
jgi:hypothetical protein